MSSGLFPPSIWGEHTIICIHHGTQYLTRSPPWLLIAASSTLVGRCQRPKHMPGFQNIDKSTVLQLHTQNIFPSNWRDWTASIDQPHANYSTFNIAHRGGPLMLRMRTALAASLSNKDDVKTRTLAWVTGPVSKSSWFSSQRVPGPVTQFLWSQSEARKWYL